MNFNELSILDILVVLSLLSVVITKIFDVLTTIRYIGQDGELNPYAGPLMQRYGVKTVSWSVFAIVVLVVVIVGLSAFLWGNTFYKVAVCVLAIFVAMVQFAAARSNAGHPNRISAIFVRFYLWISGRK